MFDDDRPIKSSYELAMERLSQEQGELAPVTDDQKRRLAEITREFRAKMAERELALGPAIEAALATGNSEEADKLRDKLKAELDELRGKEESVKDRIRSEGAA